MVKCPKCKSEEVIKWGKRSTENRGHIQRYKCNSCNETFIDDPFFKMRNSEKKITMCLDLFYRGLSTREVQSHLQAFYPHNSSNVSIYQWVKKYSLMIASFTDNLKLNTGSYIEVDEMEYHRRANHKKGSKGVDKNWFVDAIDVKTRFMINSFYSKERSQEAIKTVLSKVKDKTGDQIKTVTTDGLLQYEDVVKKTWGYNNHLQRYNVEHRKVNASKGEGFNIWVERMHNSVRQRTHGFRGLHGSIESANAVMKGYEIFYNFIKKHEALKGKTPSEMAIPSLQFETPNRWLELIKIANKKV